VFMDPRNGEVLALVSLPAYDPNAFAVDYDFDQIGGVLPDIRA